MRRIVTAALLIVGCASSSADRDRKARPWMTRPSVLALVILCFGCTAHDDDRRVAELERRLAVAERRNAELEAKIIEIRTITKKANDAMDSFLTWTIQRVKNGEHPDAFTREVADQIIHAQLVSKLPASEVADQASAAEMRQRGTSRDYVNDNYYESESVLKTQCAKEWSNDFHMREVCEREQRAGVETLKSTRPNIPAEDWATIRIKCGSEWPADYHMRTVCEREQLESYSKLRR